MGCPPIDEIVKDKDRVTIHVEGASITYVLKENGELKFVWRSENYLQLFRFRPLCQVKHEEAALEAFSKKTQKTLTVKRRKQRKNAKAKKEKVDSYDLFKNPYPVNPANFPIGVDGEYAGHSAAHIANYVSALFRNEKRSGVTEPDFKEIANKAFKELGFVGKNLSAVRSALSKEIWRRRKAKAVEIARRKIEEARQAEFDHLLLPEID